jgi:hypothetical protein
MQQPDFFRKSIDDLIRIADSNLKQLRATNKELEQLFEESDNGQNFSKVKDLNAKWPIGLNVLQTLAKVSEQLQTRVADDESKLPMIKKMDAKYKEHKEHFEEILTRIKESSAYVSEIDRRQSDQNNQRQELQEELMEEVNVREIIDMQDMVNEREKNIQEISRALNVVHTMSNQMLELTISDGLKLEGIIKQHKQHQHTVEKEIMPELQKTQNVSHKQLKQICFFGFLALILAACVVGLVYEIHNRN